MSEIILSKDIQSCIYVESEAYAGVKRIARTLAEDIARVTGREPTVTEDKRKVPECIIWIATLGKSPLLDACTSNGNMDFSGLKGRRECYQYELVEHPSTPGQKQLLIVGSDKRGTIYGMFELSRLMGVSPLIYWGDVEPKRYEAVVISNDGTHKAETERQTPKKTRRVCMMTGQPSKEPSVEYRGFFINDEWPCFGTWATEHFGGFNAAAYEKVFELLLRLKGNYMWPAMWTSCFAMDGPDLASAVLADELGVVIGNSHHEPCLRAGAEFGKLNGADSPYGTEWNYAKNKEGILRFWEDGLKRSLGFESLVTIGMRGENDSPLLGLMTPLKDNIDLLKDIILNQKRLIDTYKGEKEPRQLLALYKEVEPYFYGDETIAGLKDWDVLDDVIFMLCEDNFGNMRTLPPRKMKEHRGGWGMYYHFDYHGDPVSYEWINSTSLVKTWEQMTMAYDYGVKSVWLVNVGDLKFNIYPLQYFMELAFDFERWGTNNRNSAAMFEEQWVKDTFGDFVDETVCREICRIQKEYSTLNSLRRPESLNDKVYHSCHFGEGERMLRRADRLEADNEKLYTALPDNCRDAYFSMIYFQAAATANLLKMHLYAGQNHLYAKQGNIVANRFGELSFACIEKDRELAGRMRDFRNGKWAGMELASHVGFTHWNDQDCRYPVRMQLYPQNGSRMILSRADSEEYHTSAYWCETLRIGDFAESFTEQVEIRLGNGGTVPYHFTVEGECSWLHFSCMEGDVKDILPIVIRFDRNEFMKQKPAVPVKVQYMVKTDTGERTALEITAAPIILPDMESGVYLEDTGRIVIPAAGYSRRMAGEFEGKTAAYEEITGLGKYGSAMKVVPSTSVFTEQEKTPELTYRFYVKQETDYEIILCTNPATPVQREEGARLGFCFDQKERCIVSTVKADYRADVGALCEEWAQGVLTEEHRVTRTVHLAEGVHELTVFCVDAVVALTRIEIAPAGRPIPVSCLGAPISPRMGKQCE